MAGSLTVATKGPPVPGRNWFFGDSTTRGLAYDSSGTTPVPHLQGWPTRVAWATRGYIGAVAGHYTWEVENDLFGTQGGTTGSPARHDAAGAPNPDQWSRMQLPDRVIILIGANDMLQSATTAFVYWHASLINQLLLHGLVPYVPSRTVGDGIHDFVLMTILPFKAGTTGGGFNSTRNTANGNFITQFGQIDNTALGGSSSGSVGANGANGAGSQYTAAGYPNVTLDCSALKCMLNVEGVLGLGWSNTTLDPQYNTTTDDVGSFHFGVHLNQLGERVLATAMAPYLLAAP